MTYDTHRVSWSRQVEDYRKRLQTVTDEVARLQRWLSERVQLVPAQDFDELCSLRGTMAELSIALEWEEAKL